MSLNRTICKHTSLYLLCPFAASSSPALGQTGFIRLLAAANIVLILCISKKLFLCQAPILPHHFLGYVMLQTPKFLLYTSSCLSQAPKMFPKSACSLPHADRYIFHCFPTPHPNITIQTKKTHFSLLSSHCCFRGKRYIASVSFR